MIKFDSSDYNDMFIAYEKSKDIPSYGYRDKRRSP